MEYPVRECKRMYTDAGRTVTPCECACSQDPHASVASSHGCGLDCREIHLARLGDLSTEKFGGLAGELERPLLTMKSRGIRLHHLVQWL